jgi:hypothetical protein
MLDGPLPGRIDRANVHAVHLLAGDVEGHAALGEIRLREARDTEVPMA